MMKITVTEAATRTGKGRSTIYRAIAAGTLHRDADGALDTAELRQAGFTLLQAEPAANVAERATAHDETSREAFQMEQLRDTLAHERAYWERERALLQHELAAAHEREATARTREEKLLALLREWTHDRPARSPQQAAAASGAKRQWWWRRNTG